VAELIDLIARVDVLARTESTVRAKLEAAAHLAARVVPGCDAVSVAIVLEGEVFTAAVTDRVALEVDLIQYRFGEGPCLDVLEGGAVRVDLIEDERYQRFAPGAIDAGVLAVLSVPCRSGDRVVGSVNLYSRESGGFDDAASEAAAAPFAAYAAEVIGESQVLAAAISLVDAAASRMEEASIVNQAIGIVAARASSSMEAALATLGEIALRRGVDVRTVAEAVLEGDLLDER
jgi:GAF domain-containing protein